MAKDSIPNKFKIFCNRALNMKHIDAVGFDMDYTLALYNRETFETLAYAETVKKLIQMGYPQDILKWKFNYKHMIRGLAIDKVRGNVFKLDRHRYVKIAFHGFKELTRDERIESYNASQSTPYEEPEFALVDTVFTLPDAYLFAQLVDLKDSGLLKLTKSYLEIYKDVRHAIDLCHRDGSIKLRVAENPSKYIDKDPDLIETLKELRKSGRKMFLITNSLYDYTHVVMNYICGNDTLSLTSEWTNLFDFIITGAAKPSFFVSSNVLYEVDEKSGLLKNTEGFMKPGVVYQGGSVQQLQSVLKVDGSRILYVGDHIYGDIVRSKKSLGWRTMLVIAELEHEIETMEKMVPTLEEYDKLRREKDRLEEQIQAGYFNKSIDGAGLKVIEEASKKISEKLHDLIEEYHKAFHPVWGELMKTGLQSSRFAAQVENYACLYTGRVSNLRFCVPDRAFRSTRDYMPHDLA